MGLKVSFKSLASHWTSNKTGWWQTEREKFENTYKLYNAIISKSENTLTMTFLALPTYGSKGKQGQPVRKYSRGLGSTKSRYTIIIKIWFLDHFIKNYDKFVTNSIIQKKNLLVKIFEGCPCKVHSDDPSYLFQNGWHSCDKQGVALYKFPPSLRGKDKGIWHEIHDNLAFHVTKHIAQLSLEYKRVADMVARLLQSNSLKIQEASIRTFYDDKILRESIQSVLNFQDLPIRLQETTLRQLFDAEGKKYNLTLDQVLDQDINDKELIKGKKGEILKDKEGKEILQDTELVKNIRAALTSFILSSSSFQNSLLGKDTILKLLQNSSWNNGFEEAAIQQVLKMGNLPWKIFAAMVYKKKEIGAFCAGEIQKSFENFNGVLSLNYFLPKIADIILKVKETKTKKLLFAENEDKNVVMKELPALFTTLYNCLVTTGGSRTNEGKGVLLLSLLMNAQKNKSNDGEDLTLLDGSKIEVKAGEARMDGTRAPVNVVTDEAIKNAFYESTGLGAKKGKELLRELISNFRLDEEEEDEEEEAPPPPPPPTPKGKGKTKKINAGLGGSGKDTEDGQLAKRVYKYSNINDDEDDGRTNRIKDGGTLEDTKFKGKELGQAEDIDQKGQKIAGADDGLNIKRTYLKDTKVGNKEIKAGASKNSTILDFDTETYKYTYPILNEHLFPKYKVKTHEFYKNFISKIYEIRWNLDKAADSYVQTLYESFAKLATVDDPALNAKKLLSTTGAIDFIIFSFRNMSMEDTSKKTKFDILFINEMKEKDNIGVLYMKTANADDKSRATTMQHFGLGDKQKGKANLSTSKFDNSGQGSSSKIGINKTQNTKNA